MLLTLIFAALLSASVAQSDFQNVVPFSSLYYFDVQLLQGLSQQERGNWIISPASVKTSLGMILEGASDTTASELCHILRLSHNVTVARTELRKIQNEIENTPKEITFESGSALLVKQGLGIKGKFRGNAENHYSANIKVSDFNNPPLVSKEVNKWISDKTHGNIQEVVSPDSMSPSTIMLLANAVYFKANWNVEFKPLSNTGCFYNPDCTTVQMMGTKGAFKYGMMKSLNSRVIEMPYEDPRYSMIILLPRKLMGLEDVGIDLPSNSIVAFLDNLVTVEVNVIMPKFAIEYSLEMRPVLEKYALEKMFSERADFSDLFQHGNRAKVSSFLHKAKIEVTEKGTVAAGATVAQFQLLSSNTMPQFVVDHPFFFFVRDRKAGFLFEGQIVNVAGSQTKVRSYDS